MWKKWEIHAGKTVKQERMLSKTWVGWTTEKSQDVALTSCFTVSVVASEEVESQQAQTAVEDKEAELMAVWHHLLMSQTVWVGCGEEIMEGRIERHKMSSVLFLQDGVVQAGGTGFCKSTIYLNHFPWCTETQLHFHSARNIMINCGLLHFDYHVSQRRAEATPFITATLMVSRSEKC